MLKEYLAKEIDCSRQNCSRGPIMQHQRALLIFCMLLVFSSPIHAVNAILPLSGKTYFSPRSQSTNAARDMVGWKNIIHAYRPGENYGACAFTPEYSHSIHTHRIADYFFNTDLLHFSGSQVPDRATTDILADYFGLGTTFESTVKLVPKVQQGIFAMQFYWGLNRFWEGLYCLVQAPVVWTQWNMAIHEEITNNGRSFTYPPLYMDTNALLPPMRSVKEAFRRIVPFGQISEGLNYSRIAGAKSKLGLSEIQAAVGWNYVDQDNGHAGFNLRMSIPTGNRSNAINLFEPIVGNGHHWELGLGFSGHVNLWEKDGEQTLGIYVDVNATHLFNSMQKRSFDLKFPNGFGSRYILLKIFDDAGQYSGKTVPTVNRTTLKCETSFDIQFDIAFMFGYQYNELGFDFGYNGWIRSAERIHLKEGIAPNRYGLKGIQNVALPVAPGLSSVTQSTATLHGNPFSDQMSVADPVSPIFISTANIDIRSGAASRSISHKLFTHFSYTWPDCPQYNFFIPFLGIGCEYEFEGLKTADHPETNKPTMSFFSIWAKGGFGF